MIEIIKSYVFYAGLIGLVLFIIKDVILLLKNKYLVKTDIPSSESENSDGVSKQIKTILDSVSNLNKEAINLFDTEMIDLQASYVKKFIENSKKNPK